MPHQSRRCCYVLYTVHHAHLALGGLRRCSCSISTLATQRLYMQERIARAKRWLEKQQESVIFLYGHSVFWKSFFAHAETLRNCEYCLLHW